MCDLIDRQAAIDAILHITNCKSVRELFEYNQLHHLTEMWSGGVNDAIDAVIGVDSAQLGTNLAEVGTNCSEFPNNSDAISRQAAIDAFEDTTFTKNEIRRRLSEVPPAFGTIKHAGAENPLSDEEIIPRLREIREQVGGSYAIDRAIELLTAQPEQHIDEWCTDCKEYDKEKRSCPRWNRVIRQTLADAQPEQHNLSEAYANAVFTWLMSYQIQSAQLKGRYTPYEVIGWVLNDWRKEHDAERDT